MHAHVAVWAVPTLQALTLQLLSPHRQKTTQGMPGSSILGKLQASSPMTPLAAGSRKQRIRCATLNACSRITEYAWGARLQNKMV